MKLAGVMLSGVLVATVVVRGSLTDGEKSTGAPFPSAAGSLQEGAPKVGARRPVALALADDGKWLYVANQGRGSIAAIDTSSLRVAAEAEIGRQLADLEITPDGSHLVTVDEHAGELILLRRHGPQLETALRMEVSGGPVSVRIAPDGSSYSVASLWSRRVTIVRVGTKAEALESTRVTKVIDLDFAPRLQMFAGNPAKLIVADAFGGRLAVLEIARGEIESDRRLPAHNLRGLALSDDGKRLIISHQMLNRQATTSFEDVHWGNLLSNVVRELPLDGLLDGGADPLRDGRVHRLGDIGRGAGDPAGVAPTPDGRLVVTLAGVDEAAIGGKDGRWQRVAVGRRPTAIVVSPEGRTAYVANTFSDSIAVLDLHTNKVRAEIALGSRAEASDADRGEQLFFDARLSHDGWFSCHSCHTDGHTNGLLADTLGDGSYGTPKRVLSLLGVKDTGPWAWNGSMHDLAAQVRQSVQSTMRGNKLTPRQEQQLLAYLGTLAPPPPVGRLRERGEAEAIKRGSAVFDRQGCSGCHTPPTYTSAKTYDVGLTDQAGRFNPPSLRGVSQGGPYFHDGRAAALLDVVTRFRHQLKADLSVEEQRDLLAFLRNL
jgi:YVTN family beta-propeller protein